MTTTTTDLPFLNPAQLDELLRQNTPTAAADALGNRMERLNINLAYGHGYLMGNEGSAVCAMGSAIVLLAGQIETLAEIDLTLDDGRLIDAIEAAIGREVGSYDINYHTWLMDHTLMTFGEVKSLENGFEAQGYDPNPAGVSGDPGEIEHFYQIGVALRQRYGVLGDDLMRELEDEDDDF